MKHVAFASISVCYINEDLHKMKYNQIIPKIEARQFDGNGQEFVSNKKLVHVGHLKKFYEEFEKTFGKKDPDPNS